MSSSTWQSLYFGVVFVATATNQLLVWATKFDSRLPVSGAAVTVYYYEASYKASPSDIKAVATGSTDANGLATLGPSGEQNKQDN